MRTNSRAKAELDRVLERTGFNRLKAKHGRVRPIELPSYKIEERTAPCSNGFGKTVGKREHPKDAAVFPVGNLHKQGPSLITPGDIQSGNLKYYGGKKF